MLGLQRRRGARERQHDWAGLRRPLQRNAVAVNGITTATAITTNAHLPDTSIEGYGHTCALLSTGAVECWGLNGDGELGNGSTTGPDCGGYCSGTPVAVGSITNATAISAGGSHTCALLSTGAVECWGYNADGNLGNGHTTNSDLPILVSGFS
jgi:alpha-tubulin suppressor-like RCC1 family protein